ncbi:hypothetical protein K0504_09225 [Neiella marina]|uniref:Uncharacterized protein n=1 Tax=Neiella holothuriorum TaxID=2870530 RepID=A0ABS7EHF9_9GAMM|nr:hypothetical protein [Neiella holothuriorum]MBW8191216.1 hypothetical protein [Neiella holothuriorum]
MALNLSRRGWNNVLIFSILLFIVVIQVSQKQLLQNRAESPVLAPEAQVLSIQTPSRQFERLGALWRSTDPAWGEQQIQSWLERWYQAYPVVDANPAVSLDQMIRLQLLAQAEPLVFLLDGVNLRLQPANEDWAWQLDQQQFDAFSQVLTTP